ncbi:aminopeptidase P family protein [Oricola sp.]|uniref:aminopeptidase P family protein n=1 Tax=Oricola sp. TaxID=1979950 RepID=UPI0025DF5BC8|nr:aminopeptidase P family protein [Oricola sp.]MCI5074232.1 aminopeptidase P family protein [Oricola sp.]
MFQKFSEKSDPSSGRARVTALRARMPADGLDAFLVPHADEHQNEYLPERAERLAWLTGFTGSAGSAIILMDAAHVFTDGRYTLQLRAQTDPEVFTPEDMIATPPHDWLAEHLRPGMRIGFDPWLHTVDGADRLSEVCEAAKAELVAVDRNLVDAIRNDLPAPPLETVTIHPLDYAGETARDKTGRITDAVKEKQADALVMTDPASICWLFNIRGGDVSHTPLALAFAVLPVEGEPTLFIDKRKLPVRTEAYLTQLATLRPPSEFEDGLKALGEAGLKVMIDPGLTARAIADTLRQSGAALVEAPDPVRLPRACKNTAEQAGARNAQRRDGAALAAFLAWLDAQGPETLDEIAVVTALEDFRAKTGERLGMDLADISFDTICGSGPNGAVIHYRVTEKTNRKLHSGELLLVDSGGQYHDGTTDITRVIPLGEPSSEHRRHFTLVLKGMIAISMARFPKGTRGVDIDAFARSALWQAGLDYAHGTGHGVGSFLGVHEGPQTISRRGMQTLLPGMIVSNEPGYYKAGSHGIRIENLVMVRPAETPEGGEIAMHDFETLTLCPIDRRLIEVPLLSDAELDWLNAYHARVREEVGPLVDDADVSAWLEGMTAPLSR